MQVSGVISDASLVIPRCGGLRLPDFRHLYSNSLFDSKSFLFSAGFYRVSSAFFLFLFFFFLFLFYSSLYFYISITMLFDERQTQKIWRLY